MPDFDHIGTRGRRERELTELRHLTRRRRPQDREMYATEMLLAEVVAALGVLAERVEHLERQLVALNRPRSSPRGQPPRRGRTAPS